jgi:hypothetical protein
MSFTIIKKFLTISAVLSSILCAFALPAFAQQTNINSILLEISKVTKDGQTLSTQKVSTNVWKFDGELNRDDEIRYRWNAVSLDLNCKNSPKKACGYLKVYVNDDTSGDNLLTEIGSSPLSIDSISSKLKEGDTKILFVYIDSTNPGDTSTKVVFSFKYKNATNKPQMKIISPAEGVLLATGVNRDFIVELNNFELETSDSNKPNRGKLNVYYTEVKAANRIATFSSSLSSPEGKVQVKFNSKDLDAAQIPDGLDTKLIFALTKTSGEVLSYQTELKVKTNYKGSINVGLPRVSILEPRKDRTNLVVDGNQKFILQVENFTVLQEFAQGPNNDNNGYLQVFIDDAPIKTLWPKTEFSLNEIGAGDISEGRKTVKVQLVNKDFTKLVPEAVDSIDVVYAPALNEQGNKTNTNQVQNNTWRIIMVILTVVLVIGGIAVLITKG